MKERQRQLIECIAKGDEVGARRLLQSEPTLLDSRDTEGRTPILLALYFGRVSLARAIRASKAEPDLFEVVALGEEDSLARRLASDPASANAVAPDGFGALGLATFFGHLGTARLLLGAGADPNSPSANELKVRPIHSAAANRDPELSLALCRELLEAGADPNVAQAGGWTPLHQAAAHGRLELAQLLLAEGADPHARSEDDRTPAEMAAVKGHPEVETLLREAEG